MVILRSKWAGLFDLLPIVLLAASLALNVNLGLKLKNLSITASADSGPLKVGTQMPRLWVVSPNGERVKLDWFSNQGKSTVLYIFTPTCIWCKKNAKNILFLNQTRRREYEFLGLSLTDSGLSDYLKKSVHIENNYYIEEGPKSLFSMSIGETPTTIVVSNQGVIEQMWRGAYIGTTKKSVESVFHLNLPGIAAD
jgi:peroxiredoxin